jgi:hypothetical protein
MSNRFTPGYKAICDCDVCGRQFKLKKLKALVIRTKVTNIMACPECWNPDHPQNMQGMYPVEDPQALRNPRPDLLMYYGSPSRNIQWGWNPVGFNNVLGLPIPDNLASTIQIGTVTVVTS